MHKYSKGTSIANFCNADRIEGEHGFAAWDELRRAAKVAPLAWRHFTDYREELAIAKRRREDLFRPGPATNPGSRAGR